MRAFLVSVLFTFSAWAQSPTFFGNWLSKPEYVTQAAATYFIDPLGTDSGPCLASGTGACLTMTGVTAKLPMNIAHTITINVAAGTYTSAWTLSGYNFLSGGFINIVGPATANVTPATGTATGSLSAVSNTAVPAAVMTDGTQTWTVDDFKGRYLELTSGPGSGLRRIIMSNTATTLTLSSSFSTAPVATNTYAITSPSAVISAASPLNVNRLTSSGIQVINSSLTLTGVSFEASTATIACNFSAIFGRFDFVTTRCISGTTGLAVTATAVNMLALNNNVIQRTASSGTSIFTANNTSIAINSNSGGVPFVYGPTTGSVIAFSGLSNNSNIGLSAETTAAGTCINVSNDATLNTINVNVNTRQFNLRCPSGSGVGASVNGSAYLDNVNITNCATQISATKSSSAVNIDTAAAFDTATTALSISAGGVINLLGTTPTFTTITNELFVDSVAFTFASLGTGIMNLTTGSQVLP